MRYPIFLVHRMTCTMTRIMTHGMRAYTIMCLLGLIATTACTRKVCPSYESAFIRSDSLRIEMFTPFTYAPTVSSEESISLSEEDNDFSSDAFNEEGFQADPFAASPDENEGEDEEEDYENDEEEETSLEELTPAVAPKVKKNKRLLITRQLTFLKKRKMRTVKAKKFTPPLRKDQEEEEEIEEEEEFTEELGEEETIERLTDIDEEDPFATSLDEEEQLSIADTLAEEETVTEATAEDEETEGEATEEGEEATEEETEATSPYLYGYDPEDNFNAEQEFYNSLFGQYLLAPAQEEEVEEIVETDEIPDEEVDVPEAFSEEKYEEYLSEEEDAQEGEEDEDGGNIWGDN